MSYSESSPGPKALTVGLAMLGFATLVALPVLCAHHLVLLDSPPHESRLAILRDLLINGRGSPFYQLDTFFLPNVAFDVVGLGLSDFFSPENAGRIFFALTLLLTMTGVVVLNRIAIGRWSLVPLASALLLYNLVSCLGFFSYTFGLALVPWLLAARIKLESAPLKFSLSLGAVFGIILLFCHVFDFAIYAVMLFGFGLTAVCEKRTSLGRALLWTLEIVPASLLFLFMPTGAGSSAHYEPHFVSTKLLGLAKSVTSGSIVGDAAFAVGSATFILFLVLCSRPRLVRSFIPGLIVLSALYFILPAKLASGSYVDSRMPIAVLLLSLAGLDVHVRWTNATRVLVAFFVCALTVKQAAVAFLWQSFDKPVDRMVRVFNALPSGAVILQAECEPDARNILGVYRERQPSMSRVSTLAAFEDTRFVAVNHATRGQQPIRVAPAYEPYFQLQGSFEERTCSPVEYRNQLAQIQTLVWNQMAAGHAVPPIFYFLIRPPVAASLATEAALIARDAEYELYAVRLQRRP